MTKILLDATALPKKPVGAGVYITRLVRELLLGQSEFEFRVLAHEDDFSLFQLDDKYRDNFIFVKDHGREYRILSEQFSYPSIIRREKPNLYHGLHYSFPFIHECPVVTTVHDMTYFIYPEKHLWLKKVYFKFFVRYACRKADRILSVSESTKDDLLKYVNCDPDLISVTQLGVDREFAPVADQAVLGYVKLKYDLPDDFLLFVGLIEPRKNIGLLIEAFAHVIQKTNTKTHLVIAGRWGWESKSILDMVKQLNLEDKVHFPGYIAQEDLPALYSLAEIFVYPSLYEGFGLPVLEAMACGTPVITTNTSSMPEFVCDCGILVQPGKLDELTFAIQGVLNNPDKRNKMKISSIKQASFFSWTKTANFTIDAYRKVLENRG